MDPRTPDQIAKKLCNMVRVAYFMIQKVVSKSKYLVLDLHLMMKRSKILGKALNDLMLQHHTRLSCVPHDVHMSFISPGEYEFSCSTTPAYPFHSSRRRAHYYYYKRKHRANYKHKQFQQPPCGGHETGSNKRGCGGGGVAEASPVVSLGFGWSPLVRQVRITDSPFQVRDADEDCHVDTEAEKFIERFYKDLRLQKWMAANEAADHYG